MSDATYVPDRLYDRLFQPWNLPESDHPRCAEDWARVNAITALPWRGRVLDVGSGDGTLAAMVCSLHPGASVRGVEVDAAQVRRAREQWQGWPLELSTAWPTTAMFDGALCCELLEHLPARTAADTLTRLHACLAPGALACVTIPHPSGRRADYPGHINLMDADGLVGLVDAARFDLGTVETIDHPQTGEPIWIMVVGVA